MNGAEYPREDARTSESAHMGNAVTRTTSRSNVTADKVGSNVVGMGCSSTALEHRAHCVPDVETPGGPMTEMAFGTAALLKRAGSGDQAAWDELVARHTNLLWAVARSHRLDPADAADAIQTTWLRLLEHIDRINDPTRLGGWLVTTVRRECLRILRRSGRERLNPNDDTLDVADDTAEPVDARMLVAERDAELWAAFKRMPDRCQQLLRVLMTSPPPSYDEVSAALDMPIGSIGPTRARCLTRLRALLRGTGIFPAPRESSEGRS